MMWGIEVNNITKRASRAKGTGELIFENFNLRVQEAEILGIFGPNGCGKTTLLNMIAGIAKPDAGQILVLGQKPGAQSVAYIFQDYRHSLLPWLTVKNNIILPLVFKKMKQSLINEKLDYLCEVIKIPFSLDKYPYQLSGGQQQYISILRGLIADPVAMLVDEPFSALDQSNSRWLMEKMAEILSSIKIPAIFVAHDLEHLLGLVQRVCFLSHQPTRVIMEENVSRGGLLRLPMANYLQPQELKDKWRANPARPELSYGWD